MVAHKTARGKAALDRLKVFEGIPPPYDTKKRMVVPQALRVLRLKPGRKYCSVGRLSSEFGWNYGEVVSRCVITIWRYAGMAYGCALGFLLTVGLQTRGEEKDTFRGLLPEEEDPRTQVERCQEGGEHQRCRVGRLRVLDTSRHQSLNVNTSEFESILFRIISKVLHLYERMCVSPTFQNQKNNDPAIKTSSFPSNFTCSGENTFNDDLLLLCSFDTNVFMCALGGVYGTRDMVWNSSARMGIS